MEKQGVGTKFTGQDTFDALFNSGNKKRGPKPGSRGNKAKSKKEEQVKSSYQVKLDEALKEAKMQESPFLRQYIRNRAAAQLRNKLKKLEKIKKDDAIKKAKAADFNKVEIVARFNTKDFTMLFWLLRNGEIYKEVHCRPGLKIGMDDKLIEIETGFKVNPKFEEEK